MDKIIYTIGREFGSGGLDIAKELAKRLNIPLYDKELLNIAAEDSGLCEDILKLQDEKPTSSFLYSLVMDAHSFGSYNPGGSSYMDMPLNQKVFLAQFNAIKKAAAEGSCVIVGRCADYVLEDDPNCVSVFIHADKDVRLARVMKSEGLSDNKAKDLIKKTDKQRSSYYNFYTNKIWGDARSYDMTLDSGRIGKEGCVEAIIALGDYIKKYK
ncbi:MAG: cytidylate kinase-like family protein [Lachnospiraceae bacterium]|nr:cytidylate kinase-like family protein [Lachnospiraceae bacterium]